MRHWCLAALALLLVAAMPQSSALAQMGGSGSHGSGDSGGEQPYGGNPFREDEMRQQLEPEGASDYAIGLQLLGRKQYGDARTHLLIALADKPNDAGLLFYLGYANHQLGLAASGAERDADLKAAARYYARAASLDPDDRRVHEYLGMLDLLTGDGAAAGAEAATLGRLCPAGCDELAALQSASAQTPPPSPR